MQYGTVHYSVYYKEENVQCQGIVHNLLHNGLVVSVRLVYTICYTLVLLYLLESVSRYCIQYVTL